MIGRAYRNPGDDQRARVWQRVDGRWDFEVVKRLPRGGWYVQIGPATDEDPVYESERIAMMHVIDTIMAGTHVREQPIPLEVGALTEGWPPRPGPYQAPPGAHAIEVGQLWSAGQQVTRVLVVEPGVDGLRIKTENVHSARATTSTRKSAEWVYNEERFRKKFRLAAVRNSSTWNGMCLAGTHGLDFEGQDCDVCQHEHGGPCERDCRRCQAERARMLHP